MGTETLKFYGEYNRLVNRAMNGFLSDLTEEQWNRRFGGYFSSVRSLCNHIYVCDYNWLRRFALLRDFLFIEDTEIAGGLDFGRMHLADQNDYMEKRDWLDQKIEDFIWELREYDLGKNLTYEDSGGQVYTKRFGRLVLHMFNHQTHHRGMISLYLEEMGVANDFCSIYDYI